MGKRKLYALHNTFPARGVTELLEQHVRAVECSGQEEAEAHHEVSSASRVATTRFQFDFSAWCFMYTTMEPIYIFFYFWGLDPVGCGVREPRSCNFRMDSVCKARFPPWPMNESNQFREKKNAGLYALCVDGMACVVKWTTCVMMRTWC